MVQIIFISVAVTSLIALISSIYKLGVHVGRIQACKWIERELEKSSARLQEILTEQLKGDTRRSDELLANDNGGGAGTGESQETRKSI